MPIPRDWFSRFRRCTFFDGPPRRPSKPRPTPMSGMRPKEQKVGDVVIDIPRLLHMFPDCPVVPPKEHIPGEEVARAAADIMWNSPQFCFPDHPVVPPYLLDHLYSGGEIPMPKRYVPSGCIIWFKRPYGSGAPKHYIVTECRAFPQIVGTRINICHSYHEDGRPKSVHELLAAWALVKLSNSSVLGRAARPHLEHEALYDRIRTDGSLGVVIAGEPIRDHWSRWKEREEDRSVRETRGTYVLLKRRRDLDGPASHYWEITECPLFPELAGETVHTYSGEPKYLPEAVGNRLAERAECNFDDLHYETAQGRAAKRRVERKLIHSVIVTGKPLAAAWRRKREAEQEKPAEKKKKVERIDLEINIDGSEVKDLLDETERRIREICAIPREVLENLDPGGWSGMKCAGTGIRIKVGPDYQERCERITQSPDLPKLVGRVTDGLDVSQSDLNFALRRRVAAEMNISDIRDVVITSLEGSRRVISVWGYSR